VNIDKAGDQQPAFRVKYLRRVLLCRNAGGIDIRDFSAGDSKAALKIPAAFRINDTRVRDKIVQCSQIFPPKKFFTGRCSKTPGFKTGSSY
jgi:hypothetical protein